MDLGSVAGLLLGVFALVFGMTANLTNFANLGFFLDPASFAVVMVGTIASTFITFPMSQMKTTFAVGKNAFVEPTFSNMDLIKQLVNFANIARVEGVLQLESRLEDLTDDFLSRSMTIVVNGMDSADARILLENELSFVEERHSAGQDIFDYLNKYSPAFGMIGTLMGLVLMLNAMGDDPGGIGPAMSIALITTFYGAIMSNLIFTPICSKLKMRHRNEMLYRQITIEGTVLMLEAANARVVEGTLKGFLPPKEREMLDAEAAAG
ncbi:TPA: motility protein A [Candidatus Poribacteria bacterium]|nr:motility protein A [Candidatus Poribacteria bacterium]|tara:strand:- start:3853 stop:4647 length:795 start_codon:yes stop_codon:yes gene_type:complete